jgi:amidase
MSTFITHCDDAPGEGIRLAIKDLIDVAGLPTTAGCKAVASQAEPKSADAACMRGARASGVRIVGKTNLHELALGVTGVNPWFGTPVNPLDPTRVPGGSSSGSAVAVATGEADVAFGTDTGGSVRIPAACCGVTGLKTTWGRVDLTGVWPLAPSLDTVGPMAKDIAMLASGMALLEPGFNVEPTARVEGLRVGRLSIPADTAIDHALDQALSPTGWDVRELDSDTWLPAWEQATAAAATVLVAEAWQSDRHLVEQNRDGIGEDVLARLEVGMRVAQSDLETARKAGRAWGKRMEALLEEVDLVVTPTLTIFPPESNHAEDLLVARCTLPVNLAGLPALAMPVPSGSHLPASLQLIGPRNSESLLLAAGSLLERSLSSQDD